jgi:hypothetical protein
MAFVHRTTLTPSKLELLTGWLPRQPWYRGGPAPELTKVGGFRLDDPDGAVGIEFMAVSDGAGGHPVTYHVPMTYRGAPLDGGAALIGTAEHGVLGHRWIYDGATDPLLLGQLAALLRGRAEPQAQSVSDTPDPTVTRFLAGDPSTELAVDVERVLRDGEPPTGVAGYVTATWLLAAGGTARGTFATARPGAHGRP